MPTYWCPAGTSGCLPARAAASPARDRRPDPRCRKARSRTRAGSAPPTERRRELTDRDSLTISAALLVQTLQKLAEPIGDALAHHVIVHGPELLADFGLNVTAEGCVVHRSPLSILHGRRSTPDWLSILHRKFPHPYAKQPGPRVLNP